MMIFRLFMIGSLSSLSGSFAYSHHEHTGSIESEQSCSSPEYLAVHDHDTLSTKRSNGAISDASKGSAAEHSKHTGKEKATSEKKKNRNWYNVSVLLNVRCVKRGNRTLF